MGYIIYAIYFILAFVFRKQPHIAVMGIAITDIAAYLMLRRGSKNA